MPYAVYALPLLIAATLHDIARVRCYAMPPIRRYATPALFSHAVMRTYASPRSVHTLPRVFFFFRYALLLL